MLSFIGTTIFWLVIIVLLFLFAPPSWFVAIQNTVRGTTKKLIDKGDQKPPNSI